MTTDPAVASSQYDILWCSETFVSDFRHVSGSWVRSPCLVVPGQAASRPWDGEILHEMDMEYFANQNLSVGVVK